MKNESYYNKIKRFFYKKFDRLEVIDIEYIVQIYYKNEEYAEIIIKKDSGSVYYSYSFSNKTRKYFYLTTIDFENILKMWVEDKFKIKVNRVEGCWSFHTNSAFRIIY